MKTLIVTDFRLYLFNNHFYLNDTTYITVRRYKEAFGSVSLCTRVQKIEKKPNYIDVTDYLDEVFDTGPLKPLLFGKRNTLIKEAVSKNELIILRVPSIASYKAFSFAKKLKKRVLSIAIGCPWDAYWNHSLLGKAIAPYMFFHMKKVIKGSDYVLYVTNEFLQKRYPNKKMNAGISDVMIENPTSQEMDERRERIKNTCFSSEINVATIADVGNRIKGHRYVIKAMDLLRKKGINVIYHCIGGGNPKSLIKLSEKHMLQDQIIFTGRLTASQVSDYLRRIDIYIHPSLTEGLSRAIVEAMKAGCPVIAAKTGGNPEIVANDLMTSKKSFRQIADKVEWLIKTNKLSLLSDYSFKKATEFSNEILANRRDLFFKKIIRSIYES